MSYLIGMRLNINWQLIISANTAQTSSSWESTCTTRVLIWTTEIQSLEGLSKNKYPMGLIMI